jgi:DNA-directed RNA polymerase specialized sigma24 family protein
VQAAKHWERIETSPEAYVRRTMYHQNISWWRRRRVVEPALSSYDGAAASADTDLRLTLDQASAGPSYGRWAGSTTGSS